MELATLANVIRTGIRILIDTQVLETFDEFVPYADSVIEFQHHSPQQRTPVVRATARARKGNFDDCGVFMLMTIRARALGGIPMLTLVRYCL